MTKRSVILFSALILPVSADAAYTYWWSDTFSTINTNNWFYNPTLQGSANGLINPPGYGGGSVIWKLRGQYTTSPNYQVKSTLALSPSAPHTFEQYLRSSSNPDAANADLYKVQLVVSTNAQGTGTGWLYVWRQAFNWLIPGMETVLVGSTTIACNNGMTLRSAVIDGASINLLIFANGIPVLQLTDNPAPYFVGEPGVAIRTYANGAITRVDMGPKDSVAPNSVTLSSINYTTYPQRIDATWAPASDDANGVGVWRYKVHRNGAFWMYTTAASFSDQGLSPGTAYTYTIYTQDQHLNLSAGTTFSASTPGTGINPILPTPPARTGVRPTGAYWGAGGEQIDLLSGNLNFTVPLVKAQGRGGWGVTLALNYNSQLWSQQQPTGGSLTTTRVGKDVGYGFGWRLMAGSIAPFWADLYTISHYIFTDSSGADYKLDVLSGGRWTSKEGVYVSYEPTTQKLFFRDGSVWVMGCESLGSEPDAGTRYPTLMQDTNGNQIKIRYQTGNGAGWANSSARISEIEDVRAVGDVVNGYKSYTFTYNADSTPHLTQISVMPALATGEIYTFSYLANQTLQSPFGSAPITTQAHLLTTVTNSLSLSHAFEYTGGAGEMSKLTFPHGGYIKWTHRNFVYNHALYGGTRTVREVSERRLAKSSGATETLYILYHDDGGDASRAIHYWTVLRDPLGPERASWFITDTASWALGVQIAGEQRNEPWFVGQIPPHRYDFNWALDAAANPYVGLTITTLDKGASYQTYMKTEETRDAWGNVTNSKIWDFRTDLNFGTPARETISSYLGGTNYTSRHIYNRLVSTSVNGITVVTNTYDSGGLANVSGLRQHDTAYYGTGMPYRGNVTLSTSPGKTSNMAYDITGTAISGNDGQGHTASATMSSTNNYAVPSSTTVNGTTQNLSWNAFNGLTQQTGANNEQITIGYDGYARPSSTTSPHGAATTFTYTNSPPTKTATTNGRWVKTTMDGLGRTIKVEAGYSTTTVSVVDTEYDSCACSPVGKMKRTSQPYAPAGTVYWTTNTYDGMGRTVSVASPSGTGTTTYIYQGNTVKVTDPAGKWKKFTTDAMGNLVQVNEPNPAGGADYVTTYTYDALSHLTQVSMPRPTSTQARTFVYNSTTQRLTSTTNPENGTVNYTYNADGTTLTKIDAKNQKVAFEYDGYARPTYIRRHPVSSGAEDTCQQARLYYDTNTFDGSFTQNGNRRLVAAQWGGSTCAGGYTYTEMYSYTPAGLMTKKRLRVASTTPAWQRDLDAVYTYDNEGKMTSVKYPTIYPVTWNQPVNGPTYTYTFDSMGRPNKLTDDSPTPTDMAKDLTYGVAGEMTQIKYLSAGVYTTEARTYNVQLQMTRLTATHPTAGTQLDMQYIYSATQNNGRITQQKDWVSGEEVSYTYDSLQRLATAVTTSTAWGLSWSYDGFGNRTAQTVTKGTAPAGSWTVDAATNRLTGTGYAYDLNGNQTLNGVGNTLAYDIDNRLVTAGGETYRYGPDNKRVWKKKANNDEEFYFYGVGGQKLGTYKIAVQTQGFPPIVQALDQKIYFGGKLIIDSAGAALTDRLGSRRSASMRYFPYGEEQTASANEKDKFGTYYRDATGLDYADQRFYASTLGRFLTPDPYKASGGPSDPASWNRYTYVQSDPINFNDPSGLLMAEVEGDIPTIARVTVRARSTGGAIEGDVLEAVANRGERFARIPRLRFSELVDEKMLKVRNIILDKSFSEDCEKALSTVGLSGAQVRKAASNVNIMNAEAAGNVLFSSLAAFAPGEVYDRVQSQEGMKSVKDVVVGSTWGAAQVNGHDVYFNYHSIAGASNESMAGHLMHELLHNLGKLDGQLVTAFGLEEIVRLTGATDWISEYLKKKCLD